MTSSPPPHIRLLNLLGAIRGLSPFDVMTAEEDELLRDLIVRWHDAENIPVSEIMKTLANVSETTAYRRLISLRDKGLIHSFKKSFLALLKLAGVTHNADGRMRTPYSLRHTYATERLNAGVQEYHLAQNMGTSVAMLEQHYGHTSNVGNVRELTKRRPMGRAAVDLEWLAA